MGHLAFLLGLLFGVTSICGIPFCSDDGQLAFYNSCNLTEVPQVPNTIIKLFLSYNYIRVINATSFPLLEMLLLLQLGTQHTPLIIEREAFRNLPNLRILDIGYSKIQFLHTDAFQGLPNLFELRLFSCHLSDSILKDGYFRNLHSLAVLDLSINDIQNIHLHPSFEDLKSLESIDLSQNQISHVCERDLKPLQGKRFSLFNLSFNILYSRISVNWEECMNPFQSMFLEILDVSGNGWTADITQNFCRATNGTKILSLFLKNHIMGPGFGFHNIKEPDQDTFADLGMSSIIKMDISHGFIYSLNFHLFKTLRNLEFINLSHNKVNKIAIEAFYGLDSLQILNLSYNLLGELYNSDFYGLYNISYIDLQKNHIGAIQAQTFKSLKNLQTLDLRDNAIKTVDFLPSLTMVLLSGNKLVSFERRGITVEFLDLSENRLESLTDFYTLLQIPGLKFLILNKNRFSVCYQHYFSSKNYTLEQLYLSENILQLVWQTGSCWNMFKGLYQLKVLFLNNNYLSFLPPDVFSDLTALQILSLHANKLTSLSPGVLPANLRVLNLSHNLLLSPDPTIFASLSHLDISHNQYICDCEAKNFILWLNQTNVTMLGSPEDVYCTYPDSFSGVSLYSLSTEGCDEEEALKFINFTLFIFFTTTLTLFLTATVIFTKFRGLCFSLWHKMVQRLTFKYYRQGVEEDQHKYDAYLCFSNKDFEWVQNALLNHLDSRYNSENRFNLCFEERDFLPGEDHISNIRDAIWSSRKTICIVTRHFLKDGWCIEAFNSAQSRYFSDLKDVLIMVVAGSLSQYQLMKYPPIRVFVQRQPYLKWPEDLQDVGWFLNKLSQSILTKKEEKKKSNNIPLQTIATIS
ncbi:toll-like receptor 5 [Antechinus flavipes]|uniref:toll-like receptor 5 n=1 Tax=Antechinus flavipes TaxID=38775 RepID=UPI002236A67C|nr:toll-like receptor 5 [Antechinus flavipes]XP_051849327.1 toll-like receptor 5 [Antechinus flavipes]